MDRSDQVHNYAEPRERFRYFLSIPTRWMDTDPYGHVNQAQYLSYFDTLINTYLIEECGFDHRTNNLLMFSVENMCRYRRELSFPQTIDAGLRVARIGNTSVRYEIGLYPAGDNLPAAYGYFVHVFVDRATRRPTPIPAALRVALKRLEWDSPKK